jgi:DNA-binding CsgD family transcriptional regulator
VTEPIDRHRDDCPVWTEPGPVDDPEQDCTCGAVAVGLSGRELDVLCLVAAGHTNAEVGSALNVSPDTVKTYLRTAQGKLGTQDRSHSVAVAAALGLLDLRYGPDGLQVRALARRFRPRRLAGLGVEEVWALPRRVPAGTSR